MQLAWNAIETHCEAVRFLFVSPSLGAEGKRERFREAEVENEEVREGGWVN
jgi:hypothetical protein